MDQESAWTVEEATVEGELEIVGERNQGFLPLRSRE